MKNLLALLFVWCISCVAAEEYVVQPDSADGVDVWITSVFSYNSDYGVDNWELRVGGWADYYHTLLQFDVEGLPAEVEQAVVWLYCMSNRNGTSSGINLSRVDSPWDENTGWPTRPAITSLRTLASVPTVGQWYAIDITDMYAAWKDGSHPNYGINLSPTCTSNCWSEFYSSDYVDDPTLRPKLVVTTRSGLVFSPPIEPWILSGYDFGDDWLENYTTRKCDPYFTKPRGRPYVHVGFDARAVNGVGTEVRAAADGQVVISMVSIGGGWGGCVVLEHDLDGDTDTLTDRVTTLYLHVDPAVNVGAIVPRGQLIATVAAIKSVHLHFGFRRGGYMTNGPDDIYYRGALPPDGTSECTTKSGRTFLPQFPENWSDPADLLQPLQ